MFCKDKSTGKISLRHYWYKRVQKYPYIDVLQIQVIRELATCVRCGKVRISLVNLSSKNASKDIFNEKLWTDL